TYKQCFVGKDAADWLIANSNKISSSTDAEAIGNLLMELDYFSHVTRDHPFQSSGLFYRFTEDSKTGGVASDESGKKARGAWLVT
ncbi:unnamed protein product, partial [Laminaria digitata]